MPLDRVLPSLLLLSLASCAAPALGDENYTEAKGETLVALFVRYDNAQNETGIDQEAATVDLDVSYFLGDHHEIGLSADGFLLRTEVAESTNTFLGPFYNYVFKVGLRASIYVGPDVLFQDFDSGGASISEVGYGGHVGARFWYTPHISFTIEPSFLVTDFDDSVGGQQDLTRVKFGISVKF